MAINASAKPNAIITVPFPWILLEEFMHFLRLIHHQQTPLPNS